MGCGCGGKNKLPMTTAEAEAMTASAAPDYRYQVVDSANGTESFTSYVAAKSFQRKNGGRVQALDH